MRATLAINGWNTNCLFFIPIFDNISNIFTTPFKNEEQDECKFLTAFDSARHLRFVQPLFAEKRYIPLFSWLSKNEYQPDFKKKLLWEWYGELNNKSFCFASYLAAFNPLVSGGNKKVTHT